MIWSTKNVVLLANAFREAFENLDLSKAPANLPYFPIGCCSWASLFMGNYLKNECSLSPKRFVGAIHPDGDTHEWIVLNDIVIDITADQFSDAPNPVIVGKMPEWHSKFKDGEIGEILSIEEHDKIYFQNKQKPSEVYNEIISLVRRSISEGESA